MSLDYDAGEGRITVRFPDIAMKVLKQFLPERNRGMFIRALVLLASRTMTDDPHFLIEVLRGAQDESGRLSVRFIEQKRRGATGDGKRSKKATQPAPNQTEEREIPAGSGSGPA